MGRIVVAVTIEVTPEVLWESVRDIGSHVRWMADAETIRFTSERHEGIATTFDCETKIGPIRLTDRMEVTEWVDQRVIGVRHVGIVTGTGQFVLTPAGPGATRFRWEEDLLFPWWLGGRLGSVAGGVVLRLVWKRNLTNLKKLVEQN